MKDLGHSDIQWVINFHDNKPDISNQRPEKKESTPIDLLVPFLSKRTKSWLKGDLETQKKALESLEKIVESCKEIKGECIETLINRDEKDTESRLEDVTDSLKSLFHLIIAFTKLLKELREAEDEPPSEP